MGITEDLQAILDARYGRDVRQAIHDSIEEGYNIAVQAQGAAQTAQDSASAYADAALASEQAAADAQAAAEAAAEEAMSGTPEGYAALVSKVNSLHNLSDVSFALIGTAEGSALAHSIYGMSVQNGTPTPSVPVEIKSAKANFINIGKNLNKYPYNNITHTDSGITFTDNGDGSVTVSGKATAFVSFWCHTRLQGESNDLILLNGTYQISGCPSGGGANKYRVVINRTYNGAAQDMAADTGSGATVTLNGDDYYADRVNVGIAIQVYSGYEFTTPMTFKPMITLEGVDQTWEPYKSKNISTELTLRAIEVTSTDDYNLVKDGKYYVADTVDWSEDSGYVLTRRVEHLDFDSTYYSISFDNSGKFFTYYLPNDKPVSPNFTFATNWAKTNSNRFIEGAIENTSPETLGLGGIVVSNNYCRIGVDSSIATSLEDVRTWIANNPIYIEYILATPTTESITSEQAQALLGLKTYDEATSIDCVEDVAPVMDLEYSKDRNTALALTGHNMAYINDLRIGELENAAADD